MKKISTLLIAFAICAAGGMPAHAANCSQVGKSVAASRDAQLVSATAVTEGGQKKCKVTLLVKTNSGLRKRVTTTVAN